jgi:hypothetical protein
MSRALKEYKLWVAMKQRCYNPNAPGYCRYGARGITVCEEWRDSFAAFYRDMGSRPPGKSLDRRDNNGPYALWNCLWSTRYEQMANSRSAVLVVVGGERVPVAEAQRKLGLGRNVLSTRVIRKGETYQEAVDYYANRI